VSVWDDHASKLRGGEVEEYAKENTNDEKGTGTHCCKITTLICRDWENGNWDCRLRYIHVIMLYYFLLSTLDVRFVGRVCMEVKVGSLLFFPAWDDLIFIGSGVIFLCFVCCGLRDGLGWDRSSGIRRLEMQRARAFGEEKEMSTSEEDTASERRCSTQERTTASASDRRTDGWIL